MLAEAIATGGITMRGKFKSITIHWAPGDGNQYGGSRHCAIQKGTDVRLKV